MHKFPWIVCKSTNCLYSFTWWAAHDLPFVIHMSGNKIRILTHTNMLHTIFYGVCSLSSVFFAHPTNMRFMCLSHVAKGRGMQMILLSWRCCLFRWFGCLSIFLCTQLNCRIVLLLSRSEVTNVWCICQSNTRTFYFYRTFHLIRVDYLQLP